MLLCSLRKESVFFGKTHVSIGSAVGKAVLIVEDDADLAREIHDTLDGYGMRPSVALSWDAAIAAVPQVAPDLVLLDQRLGPVDTVPLLPQLRALTNAPVIILTGNRAEVDRIVALEIGADDFLQKPITGRELVARIRAHLRRVAESAPRPEPQQPSPAWRLNIQARTLHRPDGTELVLTAAEFNLLVALVEAQGQPLDREELTRRVLGRPWRAEDRALDNLVLHLRQKLGPGGERTIATIRNRGYAFTIFPGT